MNASLTILRNLVINSGLCNGTTFKVLSINHKVFRVEIKNGSHIGQNIGLITRIDLIPSEMSLPFRMKTRKLPVRLCFEMTIKKSHGQSINNLGVYIPQSVFLHGQLYVALSRAGLSNKTKVMLTDVKDTQGTIENNIGKFVLKY